VADEAEEDEVVALEEETEEVEEEEGEAGEEELQEEAKIEVGRRKDSE